MVAEGSDIAGIDDVSSVVVGEDSSHEELIRDLYPDVELVVVENPASFPGMIERGEVDALVRDLYEDWPDNVVNVQLLCELDNAYP